MQSLCVSWYNFARKHEALKNTTPAMASGLSDHVWTIKELIEWAQYDKAAWLWGVGDSGLVAMVFVRQLHQWRPLASKYFYDVQCRGHNCGVVSSAARPTQRERKLNPTT
jgi:hypothetical protein